MNEKLKRPLRGVFYFHVIVGFILIVALALASPMVIGEGQFEGFVRTLEQFNFKWLVLATAVGFWVLPILFVLTYRAAKVAGLEVADLRAVMERMLADRTIPVTVDIDDRFPVAFDQQIRVPIELETTIDIDEEMAVEARIPIDTEVPIDADVKTKVLGIGSIKVPIHARVPLHMTVPFKGRIRIKALGVPVVVKEETLVKLPPIDVPIKTRIETKINLLTNLQAAEEMIRGR